MYIIGITNIVSSGNAGVGPLLGDGVKTVFTPLAPPSIGAPLDDRFNQTDRVHWEVARISVYASSTNGDDIYVGGEGFDITPVSQGVALGAREGLPPIGSGAYNHHDIGLLDVGADANDQNVLVIVEVL